jgi:hypothetical protein
MQLALTHTSAPLAADTLPALRPVAGLPAGAGNPGGVPLEHAPVVVSDWFDAAAAAAIPDYDGSLGTARIAAEANARPAKAENTRRACHATVAPGRHGR